MIQVKFNSVAEFLAEVAREAPRVEDRVLRVTCSTRRGVPMTGLAVLATALVAGRIVRLDRFCGEYMFADSREGREVRERADACADEIRAEATKLGLEVRSGVYEFAAER